MPNLVFAEEEGFYAYDSKKTPQEVADALEKRYKLFSTFAEEKKEEIAEILSKGMEEVIQHLFETGEDLGISGVAVGVEELFADFIQFSEAEEVIEGTPTDRALRGYKTLRYPHEGQRRPSFYDTGLLVEKFRAWVEE